MLCFQLKAPLAMGLCFVVKIFASILASATSFKTHPQDLAKKAEIKKNTTLKMETFPEKTKAKRHGIKSKTVPV